MERPDLELPRLRLRKRDLFLIKYKVKAAKSTLYGHDELYYLAGRLRIYRQRDLNSQLSHSPLFAPSRGAGEARK